MNIRVGRVCPHPPGAGWPEVMIRFSRNYNRLINTGSLLGSVEERMRGVLSWYFETSILDDDSHIPSQCCAVWWLDRTPPGKAESQALSALPRPVGSQ